MDKDYVKDLVSVIIPTKNRSQLLLKAVNSVLQQDYIHLEIIIVNDCSTDNTMITIDNLIERYPSKIRTYSFENSVGASKARGKGIEMSTGEYIAFLDDDDEWLTQKLSLQVKALKNNSNLGAVSCWYYRNNGANYVRVKLAQNIISEDIYWSNILGSFSFLLIKHELLLNNNFIYTNLESCQDWDFWIQILKCASVGIIPKYLVKYNDHIENRITLNPSKKIMGLNSFIEIHKYDMNKIQMQYLLAKIHNYNSTNNKESLFTRYKSKVYSILVYYKLGHPDYDSIFKLIYSIIKYFTPKIIKKLLITKFIKMTYDEEHHQKDLYVIKQNVLDEKQFKSRMSGEIILV